MYIFYTPDIECVKELPEEESIHCARVLRLSEGEEITLTDGRGSFYRAVLVRAHQKRCAVEILSVTRQPRLWPVKIHMAVAPTKNMDRIEWFAEKATEIGIDALTLLRCRYSERKEVKTERVQKILVSAMKQSLKATLPELTPMTDFKQFISQPFDGQKFIAYCGEAQDKKILKQLYRPGTNALILIGPEGDFSEEEVALAFENGFLPVSLGESRLRTETAALTACHTIHVLNQ